MLRTVFTFLRPLRLRILALAFVFGAPIALAQSVRWEPGSGTLSRDQISQLSLVFQDAEPKEPPTPPNVPGLAFEPNPGRTEHSMLNLIGTRRVQQRTVTYTYRVRPTLPDGEVRIPAFTVDTDAGPLTVSPAGFTLAAATVGQSGVALDKIANARFVPPAAPIWAGEVFRLGHVIDVDRRYATNNILAAPLDWTPTPLVAEDWSKPTGSEALVNGQNRFIVTYNTRAIAPGATASLAIPPATQIVNLPTGTASPFSLFGQSTFEQFSLTSAPATLQVRPLPTPAPKDFHGVVGQFTLTSKIVPEKAAVGEPITWTLTLEGTGNWPVIDRLPSRELSRDFRVVSPRAQKTPKADTLFDASLSEDLVLIPQKPGRTTLGPYTFSVFNPSTGRYETLRGEPVVIEISPGAGSAGLQPAPNSANSSTSAPDIESSTPRPLDSLVAPPSPLPADPLPAGATAAAPLDHWPRLLLWLLPVLLAPAALWLAFAARHARVHDPLRLRREAHTRLNQILAALEIASGETSTNADSPLPAPSTPLLLDWQHATRALFALGSATPSARDFTDPVWSELWIETERALYSPSGALTPAWFSRAREAHALASPPPRSVLAALRPVHLFARIALWGLVLHSAFVLGHPCHAAEARDSYSAGDFPAAEKAWREAVSAAPLAWPARHNLALALAQQGKWDEAAAHAYAAALQAPRAPEARRLLDVTLPKAAFQAHQAPAPARLLSPRQWQLAALVAALLLLLTPCAYLAALHAPRATRSTGARTLLGHFALLISTLALVAAFLALRAHGPASSPDAVLVWRDSTLRAVPTDAGEQKVTSTLPAGTLARVDKAFLGWRRLVLSDGTTGWVRAEPLVGLWRTP